MLNDKKKEFISEIHDNNAEKKQKEKSRNLLQREVACGARNTQ